jgi:molybdenum cofactor biosynthesis enzyme
MTEAANADSAPETVKAARIVGPKSRSTTVPLEYPVEFDGVVYNSITVRRMTGLEVETYVKAVGEAGSKMEVQMPAIECPMEVYNALDDDDRLRVEEALAPFLPRRFQLVAASILSTIETTSAT